MSFYEQGPAGIVIAVKAQPGARRVVIGPVVAAVAAPGWPAARLKIAINAPPEDGKANAAIIAALAYWLGVKPGAISLTAGAGARDKKFTVIGVVKVAAIQSRQSGDS
jgi:uncharacterized protein YggU (UPF0235/DUF167 family)